MDNIKFIKMLYTQLRTQEGLYYLPYRYKWVLGIEVFNELKDKSYNKNLYDPEATLFEIEVKIDEKNPKRISLWKDITDDL